MNRLRDYGFIAWLLLKGYYVTPTLETTITVAELRYLNEEYKKSEFFKYNELLRGIVKPTK